jgi:hypothetical protein
VSTSNVSGTSSSPTLNSAKMLHFVPFEKGFHFFINSMNYAGIAATSLFEFAEKLQIVSARSVEYHFRRQDFQIWINDVIGDAELATRIGHMETRFSPEDV